MTEKYIHMPKVVGGKELVIDGQVAHDVYEGEVPEEIMAFAEQVIGNGAARVAVTNDVSMKDYGNGVSCSVTISLSCNQDDQTLDTVVGALGNWTKEYAKQQFNQAYEEFKTLYAQKHPGSAP